MIKRLIFDVDGTLITGVNFKTAISATLRELGICTDENIKLFASSIGEYEKHYDSYNKKDYIDFFSKVLNTTLPENFLNIFFKYLRFVNPPFNKALVTRIYELSEKYELGLLTNFFSVSQLNRLNNMKIGIFFKDIYGQDKIKPNKEAYIASCAGFAPYECVMIGDDPVLDIKKAQEIGMHTIFINTKKIDNVDSVTVNSVEDITIELIENLTAKPKVKEKSESFK